MDLVDVVKGVEGIGLPGSGCRTPHIQSADRPGGTKDDRTSRCSPQVLRMSNFKPGDIREGLIHSITSEFRFL